VIGFTDNAPTANVADPVATRSLSALVPSATETAGAAWVPPSRHSFTMNHISPRPSTPTATSDAELAEDRFFAALLAGDAEGLEELLSDDFLIVDVMSGSVAGRAPFIAALRDGSLKFDAVTLVERDTRRRGDTAIIVGRTQMAGSFAGASFAAASRYTHVLLLEQDDCWRLVTAQGTRIVDQQ